MVMYRTAKDGRVKLSDAEEREILAERAATQEPVRNNPAEKALDLERRIIALEDAVAKLSKK